MPSPTPGEASGAGPLGTREEPTGVASATCWGDQVRRVQRLTRDRRRHPTQLQLGPGQHPASRSCTTHATSEATADHGDSSCAEPATPRPSDPQPSRPVPLLNRLGSDLEQPADRRPRSAGLTSDPSSPMPRSHRETLTTNSDRQSIQSV